MGNSTRLWLYRLLLAVLALPATGCQLGCAWFLVTWPVETESCGVYVEHQIITMPAPPVRQGGR